MSFPVIPSLIIGGILLIFGIIFLIWGSKEEGHYFDVVSHRIDVREFLFRNPTRWEPVSLKIGGWIGVVIGLILLALGAGFLYLW